MQVILKYFPDLQDIQKKQFEALFGLYKEWNSRINVVSRKDIENLYERHVLHSLSIARAIHFVPGTHILDVGTGGGFPGIPLAIMFPLVHFTLIDATGKKIRVVKEIVKGTGLANVEALHTRAEEMPGKFDFVVSRAVSSLPEFVKLVRKNIGSAQLNSLRNGILYLMGGDINQEIRSLFPGMLIFSLCDYFKEEFFETKKLVFLPV
ncbi:MAG: 16S rRNA (guanine(527)-N(7))-methyltransferase RsmG [Bacteroidia bacterium]|nr:16S rRNA (guanine(527)-N(7))-methyltransferase RsmG [Bacteroidia bacterium]